MPPHTSTRASRFFHSSSASPRNRADSAAPKIGTVKLNTVTWLTRLCLSKMLHSENAADDSNAKYTSSSYSTYSLTCGGKSLTAFGFSLFRLFPNCYALIKATIKIFKIKVIITFFNL